MAAYRRVYDSRDVTCRLTAKNRDQLRNPTLGNRVWATYLLFLRVYIKISDFLDVIKCSLSVVRCCYKTFLACWCTQGTKYYAVVLTSSCSIFVSFWPEYMTCRAYSKRVSRTNCAFRIKKCAPRISSGIYFLSTSWLTNNVVFNLFALTCCYFRWS